MTQIELDKENEMKTQWKRFWFEGDFAFRFVNNKKDWQQIKDTYRNCNQGYVDLLNAQQHSDGSDSFGFYTEYSGKRTLREFAQENGMDLI